VFCPACGAKNDLERGTCFVCGKVLPSSQPASIATPLARRAPRPRDGMGNRAASVGDRMLALLFDRLLLGALALIGAAYLANAWWHRGAPVSRLALAILASLAFMLVAFAYHTLAEAVVRTTLGKAILGLSVSNEGEHGTLGAAAIRNALRVADGLPLYAVGFFVALFSPRHRRIGDRVAGTVVLSDPVPPAARAALLVTLAALVGISFWLAWQLCPECVASLGDRFHAAGTAWR
jgi:uncharacterized RDD family membrane protein YckC